MKSVCFFNNKGGVGKTTLACNLASVFAKEFGYRVLVIDCDPQCNATTLILGEERSVSLYDSDKDSDSREASTILDVLKPIEVGDSSIDKNISPIRSDTNRFHVDLVPGHPRLSILEDLLSQAWRDTIAGDIGGLRKTNWCSGFLSTFASEYDIVFLDLGPSLGSLNRSALIGSDFFVTPMGADIFSIIGLKNISEWLKIWIERYEHGIEICKSQSDSSIQSFDLQERIKIKKGFAGYTVQAYIAKYKGGEKRPTKAFERIITTFPSEVETNLGKYKSQYINNGEFALGEVPNMYSLVPLGQVFASPIGELKSSDGIVGTHFVQVKKYNEILIQVATILKKNIGLSEA